MNNKPITAYDKRNPFHDYNFDYEQARIEGRVMKLARKFMNPSKTLRDLVKSSGGNKKRFNKQKRDKLNFLQKLSRRINR